jgi:hypothetical protein
MAERFQIERLFQLLPIVRTLIATQVAGDLAVDDEEHDSPPRWLTNARVTRFVHATIIAAMVIVFVLGFRH